ncbi:MAG: alpha-galactosidase [Kiritimatiellae bacterium]|nr:alpha-galactosidase [Kiritimatiellia bacterium]
MACFAIAATFCNAAENWVRYSDDSSRIVAEAEGIKSLEGSSSAVYEMDGKNHRVGTKGYKVLSAPSESTCATPFGDAVLTTAVYGRDDSPFSYTLKLKRLKNLRAFTLQAVFHNRSDKDVKLRSFDLFDAMGGGSFKVADAAEWLVTPLMQDSPALSLSEMNQSMKEVALIRHSGGDTLLVGPVGPAEAYTTVEVRNQGLKAWVQMDNVLVRAGESRRSEEMIFCFEPGSAATDIWTRWVATTHGVRRNKGAIYGWCSWYDRTTKIDAKHVLSVTDTIEANPDTFGRGIIQIDDGYQKMDGDWSGNEKFPQGMASIAKRIREVGCIPGVWFAPLMINPAHPWGKANPEAIQKNAKGIESFMNPNSFHPDGANWINPSHPESKKFLFNIIRDAKERGYGYIKIDFNGIGSRFVDPTKTRLQIFRELYTLYREAAGDEMYILSCLGQPTRGVIGFIDAARVGPDSHPAHFNKCLESVLRFQIFDNVWWQNDADVAYIAEKLPSRKLGPVRQGDGMWKTWLASVALSSGTAMVSEPLNAPDAKEFWRNYEIMRPGSCESARLLTLGSTGDNSIFGFTAQRVYGDFAVYNLYNSKESERTLKLDFKAAGLPSGVRCAVFDFWSNKVIGYATDSYTTAALPQFSSELLRFTPLSSDGPILVGSDLHLSIGATEIDKLRISTTSITVELSDAGAQNGSLTFYSTKLIAANAAENCKVDLVENLGDNLWRVNISGRKWGVKQMISLKIK